jgi:hypothetical protein
MRRKSAQFDLGGRGVALSLAELDHRIRKFVDDDRSSGQARALDECQRLPGQVDSPDYFMLVNPDRPFARIDAMFWLSRKCGSKPRSNSTRHECGGEHADSIYEAVTGHLIADHESEIK